jgi:HSP20 family protein
MVRWYYRSLFDELEDMRNYMESLSRQMSGTNPVALLPATGDVAMKMLPAARTALRVDLTENDDEVVVTLINAQTLEISCERREEKDVVEEGYSLRGRSFGSMMRIVPLPKPVTDEGSSSTFRNGILEVHLKKTIKESRGTIAVDW